MAKFVTYIADPELESSVIKAIASINGELAIRGVSMDQVREAETAKDITLICSRPIDFTYKRIIVDKSMSTEEISILLEPNSSDGKFLFDKGRGKVVCFIGLSGGVGTTTMAINYSFELMERTLLIDLAEINPDIARALGLHRIEGRIEKISNNLSVTQGISNFQSEFEHYVFDLGSNLNHPLLQKADEIYLVTRAAFNTVARLQAIEISPTIAIFNFAERTKFQIRVRQLVEENFPKMTCLNVPLDLKSIELASDGKSALVEVASNSLARKSIATLA